MFKIKKYKVEFKHFLTAVSALGVLASFTASLASKKKTASCVSFFLFFLGLVAGSGMEAGLIKEPACFKKLEIEIEDDGDEDDEIDEDGWADAEWFDDEEEPADETTEETPDPEKEN